jgi:hypothetical protein
MGRSNSRSVFFVVRSQAIKSVQFTAKPRRTDRLVVGRNVTLTIYEWVES